MMIGSDFSPGQRCLPLSGSYLLTLQYSMVWFSKPERENNAFEYVSGNALKPPISHFERDNFYLNNGLTKYNNSLRGALKCQVVCSKKLFFQQLLIKIKNGHKTILSLELFL